VNTTSAVNVAVPTPLAVPSPELVPNSIPAEKVSVNIPSEITTFGGWLKSAVEVDCTVNEPNVVSFPSPVVVLGENARRAGGRKRGVAR
jgi:hypothetical protein